MCRFTRVIVCHNLVQFFLNQKELVRKSYLQLRVEAAFSLRDHATAVGWKVIDFREVIYGCPHHSHSGPGDTMQDHILPMEQGWTLDIGPYWV